MIIYWLTARCLMRQKCSIRLLPGNTTSLRKKSVQRENSFTFRCSFISGQRPYGNRLKLWSHSTFLFWWVFFSVRLSLKPQWALREQAKKTAEFKSGSGAGMSFYPERLTANSHLQLEWSRSLYLSSGTASIIITLSLYKFTINYLI